MLYRDGNGVSQDAQEAVEWYRKASEQGDAEAQYSLGLMYAEGQSVPQDYEEAVKWFRKAAEQGDAGAQNNLGLMYEYGYGVLQDFILAHMWFNIAGSALSVDEGKKAVKNRDTVAKRMTAAQIGKAQEMARRCQDTKFKECD